MVPITSELSDESSSCSNSDSLEEDVPKVEQKDGDSMSKDTLTTEEDNDGEFVIEVKVPKKNYLHRP